MNIRTLLAGVVGGLGVTALANRRLLGDESNFEPFLDGEQGVYRWRGFDIAYTELGDPEDDDVILLHGTSVAASSHEFAEIADRLAAEYHVIVPDLPGFGHSDRPPLLYSASLYEAFVEDAIRDLTTAPIVIASSLTSAYAAAAAGNTDVERLVLICPTDTAMGSRQVWLRTLLRSPVVGTGLYNLLVSKASLKYFNADHGYYDPENMSEDVLDYEWQTAHQPGARFAPASFVSGFLNAERSLEEMLQSVDAPTTFVWGRDVETTPLSAGRTLAESVDAGLIVISKAKLLPHVEHPEQFLQVLDEKILHAT